MPVVGIVIIGSENLAECGYPVLTQKQIQVAVVVNVAASQGHGIRQARTGGPDQPARFVERSPGRTFEEQQTFGLCAQEIRDTIAVKVRDQRG